MQQDNKCTVSMKGRLLSSDGYNFGKGKQGGVKKRLEKR